MLQPLAVSVGADLVAQCEGDDIAVDLAPDLARDAAIDVACQYPIQFNCFAIAFRGSIA